MFKKYIHLEKWDTEETKGIGDLSDDFIYIFPKLDGTNASIWFDRGLKFGSRRREISLDQDNRDFCCTMLAEQNSSALYDIAQQYPNYIWYGEWLCLSGDTEIRLVSGGKRGHYMTLREMYHYANDDIIETLPYVRKGDGKQSTSKRKSWWKRNGFPQIYSYFEDEDILKPQRIANIISTGDKPVYCLSTRKGKQIKSTKDHKFLTNNGWKPLEELSVGDVVAISDLYNPRPPRRLGKGSRKVREVFEKLKQNNNCALCGINSCLEIHHLDQNWKNNDISNLQVLCRSCHSTQHSNITSKNVVYNYEFDKITSIEYVGVEDCYDICMGASENSSSFVADNFIVHNCSHTLRTYLDSAWSKFYIFDVYDRETEQYLSYDKYKDIAAELERECPNIELLPPLAVAKVLRDQDIEKALQSNFYLMKENELGEGIVIKRYSFVNKYGRTVWAKAVRTEFTAKHIKEMGPRVINSMNCLEQTIVDDYLTEHLILKTYEKLRDKYEFPGDLPSRHIAELLQTVFYDFVTEEIWEVIKKLKYPTINFKQLHRLCYNKTKEVCKI